MQGQFRTLVLGMGNILWADEDFGARAAVPDVACAAREDIDDSAQRLLEILEVYR